MHNVPIVDLSFSLDCLPVLRDYKLIEKFTLRVQDTFEMVNPALLKQVYNQEALLDILVFFRQYRLGAIIFREKIATLLQQMIADDKWIKQKDSQKIADMVSCLRDIDTVKF